MKTAIEFFRSKQWLVLGSSTRLQARCLRPPESGTRSFVVASPSQPEKPCWQKDLELLEAHQSPTRFFARLSWLKTQATLDAYSIYILTLAIIRRLLRTGLPKKSRPPVSLEDSENL